MKRRKQFQEIRRRENPQNVMNPHHICIQIVYGVVSPLQLSSLKVGLSIFINVSPISRGYLAYNKILCVLLKFQVFQMLAVSRVFPWFSKEKLSILFSIHPGMVYTYTCAMAFMICLCDH